MRKMQVIQLEVAVRECLNGRHEDKYAEACLCGDITMESFPKKSPIG